MESATTWLDKLMKIGSNLACGKFDDAYEAVNKEMGELVTSKHQSVTKTVYFYLIDELTGEPV